MRREQNSSIEPAEAVVLNQIILRLILPQEQGQWNPLVSQHHYLKNANLVGERLCYGVESRGQWLACGAGRRRLTTSGRGICGLRLDVSAGEDRCRVRHPIAATVLGILRRAVQGEYRAWAGRQRRARDSTCPVFLERMSRRIDRVLRYLIGEIPRL